MKVEDAVYYIELLMDVHGLFKDDWRWELSTRAHYTFGLCKYKRKLVRFSKSYIELNIYEEVVDTILHEIAHALAGPGKGHGYFWKKKAIEIGARPRAFAPSSAKAYHK
jgi:hypothetical protein